MSTHIFIFAALGMMAVSAVLTFGFFVALKRTNQFLNDYVRRRESGHERDVHCQQRRRAWSRFKCHRLQQRRAEHV